MAASHHAAEGLIALIDRNGIQNDDHTASTMVSGAARPQVRVLRLGRPQRHRWARHERRRGGPALGERGTRPARLRDLRHREGPRRLLHGGQPGVPRGAALAGAVRAGARRAGRSDAGDAAMTTAPPLSRHPRGDRPDADPPARGGPRHRRGGRRPREVDLGAAVRGPLPGALLQLRRGGAEHDLGRGGNGGNGPHRRGDDLRGLRRARLRPAAHVRLAAEPERQDDRLPRRRLRGRGRRLRAVRRGHRRDVLAGQLQRGRPGGRRRGGGRARGRRAHARPLLHPHGPPQARRDLHGRRSLRAGPRRSTARGQRRHPRLLRPDGRAHPRGGRAARRRGHRGARAQHGDDPPARRRGADPRRQRRPARSWSPRST